MIKILPIIPGDQIVSVEDFTNPEEKELLELKRMNVFLSLDFRSADTTRNFRAKELLIQSF